MGGFVRSRGPPVIDRIRRHLRDPLPLHYARVGAIAARPGLWGAPRAQVVGTAVDDDKSLNSGTQWLFNDQMTARDRPMGQSHACVCAGVRRACEHLQALPVVFVQATWLCALCGYKK